MMGSQVCWQLLLLMWALFLGHLACGAEEGCCCCKQQKGSSQQEKQLSSEDDWFEEKLRRFMELPLEERIEKHGEMERRMMQQDAASRPDPVGNYLKEKALNYYNMHSYGPYYKHLEDKHLSVKKAIGTIVYVTMVLARTNCTRNEDNSEALYTNSYLDQMGCELLPESEESKMDCTFGIYIDPRSGHETLLGETCRLRRRNHHLRQSHHLPQML